MKISIITVCLNSATTIRDTIESILLQTYSDVELIVVDGDSEDDTVKILKEYEGSIAKIISEPDRGLYDAMNKGIELATGDVIGILNSDDFYTDQNVLSAIATSFAKAPNVDMLYGDIVFVNPNDSNKIVRHFTSRFFSPRLLRFGWMPPHTASFIKKSVYNNFGLYSLDYTTASDYEIFIRFMMVNNISSMRLNKVLVKMRTGGVTTSGWKSNWNTSCEIVRALRENNIYSNLFLVLSRLPIKFFLESFVFKYFFVLLGYTILYFFQC